MKIEISPKEGRSIDLDAVRLSLVMLTKRPLVGNKVDDKTWRLDVNTQEVEATKVVQHLEAGGLKVKVL